MDLKNTTLDDISAVIGFSATLRLCAWFGGYGSLYVPTGVEDGQLLVKLIGMSSAKRLTAEWPGELMSLPTLSAYEHDLVKFQIKRMLELSMSSKEVSRFMRMGEARVMQICRELESAGLLDLLSPKPSRKNSPENAPENAPENTPEKSPSKIPLQLPGGFFSPENGTAF